ncbi:hypothetical protein C8R47DRAFT_1228500 [Mycena vitilis]|nr:hypothetical protein C8R47DRAFT_1228500 [Mycena vitilis]
MSISEIKHKHFLLAALAAAFLLTVYWPHDRRPRAISPPQCLALQAPLDPTPAFIASSAAYAAARTVRDAQDTFCARAEAGLWDATAAFPESLQWEALVDVLRGRVKLSVHCYEAVDLDQLIRLSNEFRFPIASIHHAGETYLVPNLLKKAWGGIPAIALFASNFRCVLFLIVSPETARGVPRLGVRAEDSGLPVIMKQAHYYGLNPALASVTSTPAAALGVGWRLATGAAADARLGFDAGGAAQRTVEDKGLPPLEGRVVVVNASRVWSRRGVGMGKGKGEEGAWRVLVEGGADAIVAAATVGGELAPGLTTFGSDLGLSELDDGRARLRSPYRPCAKDSRGYRCACSRWAEIRREKYIVRTHIVLASPPPSLRRWAAGSSAASRRHSLLAHEMHWRAVVVQAETALHVAVNSEMVAGVSTQIAALRNLLFTKEEEGPWGRGEIPLVITVHNADIVATLLVLKSEFDAGHSDILRLTCAGATEAHLLASHIGAAGVSVVLAPARPYPETWDYRRVLPGPPLSRKTSVMTLLEHGVNVALGVTSDYDARNARFEVAWAALDANGTLDYPTAMALATTNLEIALGLDHARP